MPTFKLLIKRKWNNHFADEKRFFCFFFLIHRVGNNSEIWTLVLLMLLRTHKLHIMVNTHNFPVLTAYICHCQQTCSSIQAVNLQDSNQHCGWRRIGQEGKEEGKDSKVNVVISGCLFLEGRKLFPNSCQRVRSHCDLLRLKLGIDMYIPSSICLTTFPLSPAMQHISFLENHNMHISSFKQPYFYHCHNLNLLLLELFRRRDKNRELFFEEVE